MGLMQLEISLMQKAFMQSKEGLIKLGSRDLSRAKIMYWKSKNYRNGKFTENMMAFLILSFIFSRSEIGVYVLHVSIEKVVGRHALWSSKFFGYKAS